MESLADRVKSRRIALGLTQGQVAKISELNQSDVSKIEKGRILETTKMLGLARALQCDPDWLESGKGQPISANIGQGPKIAAESIASWVGGAGRVIQALGILETELAQLDMAGRERIAPMFESFARSPGAVIKNDIAMLLESPDAIKSTRVTATAQLQKTG